MENKDKSKTLRRGWWFREWQADQAEAWLEDKARQGWMLKSIGWRLAKFVQAEPAEVRYVCVPRELAYTVNEDRAEKAFKSAGWTYVDDDFQGTIAIFRAPEGTELPQGIVGLDPEALHKHRVRHFRNNIFLYSLLGLLLGGLFWWIIHEGQLADYLVNKENDLFWNLLFLAGCLVKVVRGVSGLFRLKKPMAECDSPNPQEKPYRRIIAVNRAKLIILVALPLLFLLGDFPRFIGVYGKTPWFSSLPTMAIYDLDAAQAKSTMPEFRAVKHSLLFPDVLKSWDESVDDNTIMQFDGYHALMPGIAEYFATQLALHGDYDDYFWFLRTPMHPQADLPGFDRIMYSASPDGSFSCFVALKGRDVYCLVYSGKMSANDIASALNRKILSMKSP